MPFNDDLYDGIYCFNVLHLFLRDERMKFLKNCHAQLEKDGFVFFVAFSEEETSFGKGKKVEDSTFESKPRRSIHYFTEDDLTNHFIDYSIIETGLTEEEENHGEIEHHFHVLRYIFAQKSKKIHL